MANVSLRSKIANNLTEIKEEQKVNHTRYTQIHQIVASPAWLMTVE